MSALNLSFRFKNMSSPLSTIEKMQVIIHSISYMFGYMSLKHFKPKYIFMAGICAGIEGPVKLGDIIVTEQSWDYGSGKIKDDNKKQNFYYDSIRTQ